MADSGLLVILAKPDDDSLRLDLHERVLIDVTTAGGDSERVGLAPLLCPPEPHLCSQVSILMHSGESVLSLKSEIASIGAVLRYAGPSGVVGAAWVLEPLRLEDVIAEIATFRGVRVAEHDVVFVFDGNYDYSELGVGIPISRQQVVREDGALQIGAGDTIRVRSRDLDGSLEATLVVPGS